MKGIKLCSLGLAVVLSLNILGGCSGGSKVGGAAGGGGSSDSKEITITVLQQNDDAHSYFEELGEEFKKTHPNVTIKRIGVPGDQFDSKLQTMIASNTPPDITTHVSLMGFKEFYAKDMITDLTPYAQKYGFDATKYHIPDNVMNMATVDGKIYGIPQNTYTTVLLYNKDLFDKAQLPYPPTSYKDMSWTFDKMVEDAKKLTTGSGNDRTYGLYWQWDGGGSYMCDPEYFGCSMFDKDALKTGYATKSNLTDPKVINAFQTIADLTFKDKVSPTPAYVTALAGGSAGNNDPFLSGKIAMEVEGAWGLVGFDDIPFNAGVAAVPVGPNKDTRCLLYTDPYVIMKGSKHKDEAFQYLQFLLETENQNKMISISKGEPPANIESLPTYYNNFKKLNPKDLNDVIEGSLAYGTEDTEHLIVGSGEIHNQLTNELSPIFNENKSAQDICTKLSPKLDSTLEKINAKK